MLFLGDTTLTGGQLGDKISQYVQALEAPGANTGVAVGLLSLNHPEVLMIIGAGQAQGYRTGVPRCTRLARLTTAPTCAPSSARAPAERSTDVARAVSREHEFDDMTRACRVVKFTVATIAARRRAGSVRAVSGTQRIHPLRWLKPMNKLFVQLTRLGLQFGGAGPMVLTVAGRKSGQPRSTPVTPMTIDGRECIVDGFPGAGWIANVCAAGEATVARGRRREQVRIIELSPDRARPLWEWPIQVPTGAGFLKRAGLVTEGRPEEIEALADSCPVFSVEPCGVEQT